MSALAAALPRLAAGETLNAQDAEACIAELMDGGVSEAVIGGFLMALKLRGETPDELVGGARALRARAQAISAPNDAVDTCGTGGGWSSFNVSTAAALVAAGAGARIAKHGNKTVTRKSGSADVLAALGVNIDAGPAAAERSLNEAGVCFLYAPAHHAAMRHVGPARRALGLRTVFNSLGPLANPAGAKRQLIGVNEPRLVALMAQALIDLGVDSALVVHGHDGLDEITTTGPTTALLVRGETVSEMIITPEDAGLERVDRSALQGGGPAENAAAIRAMLSAAPGALREIAALNAGAALMLAERADTIAAGVKLALTAIDDGRALTALERLIAITQAAGVPSDA